MISQEDAAIAAKPPQVLGDAHALAQAVADDLELLAILHDREPSASIVSALKACPIEDQLTLRLTTAASRAALQAFAAAVADIPQFCDGDVLDVLAAGYADVYLRHAYRAMPTESVWLTEDGLDRQGPMLAVRAEHRRHGLRMTDWNQRPEDHLVPQVRFIAVLAGRAKDALELEPVVRFLDAHLLRWIHPFAARLVQAGAPPLYTALAVLTACYLDEVRGHLQAITGIPLPVPQAKTEPVRARRKESAEDRPFLPGVAPSW